MSAFYPNGSRSSAPRITRAFGYRSASYSRGWHTGDDTAGYDLNCAAESGVVIYTGYDGSYGNTVIVQHDDGTKERTAHGAAILVSKGQRVQAGQALMRQGTTGMSTGKHNHQEIILPNGQFTAPMAWIRAQQAAASAVPAPAATDSRKWIDLTNWFWYRSPANAQAKSNKQRPLLQGKYPIISRDANGAIQVLSNSLGKVWVHSSADPVAAPVDVRLWWRPPAGGQFYYNHYNNALNGNYDRNQLIPASAGELYVVKQDGSGPILVQWGNRQVWVGTRRNPLYGYRK